MILITVSRYITPKDYERLLNELGNYNSLGPGRLRHHIGKFFDYEDLVKKPHLPEDAILGNYLIYDAKESFPLRGPITKFVKAFIREDVKYWEKVNARSKGSGS